MAKHFEMTQKMDAINGTLGALDKTSLEQRQLLLSVLVHAADISHVVPIRAAPVAAGARVRTRAAVGRTQRFERGRGLSGCVRLFASGQVFDFSLSFAFSTLVRPKPGHSVTTSRLGALAPRRCRGTGASQVRTEFAEQAAAEKALGIEPLPFMVETEPAKVSRCCSRPPNPTY